MVSLNDVLLAMSNIPVDDPIAEIWGRGLQGGYKIVEYTGSLPITITANGDALIDYRIYGDTVQDRTPTPENPIMPIGCGERTENLFEVESDMLSSLNWDLNPSYGPDGLSYFISYKLSDAVTQELKKEQHTCSIFRHFTDGYIPRLLVCAFTPTTTYIVDLKYRILTNNGITYTRTFDFSEWQDIYLVIGYGDGFITEEIEQSKIDELFTNWEISIVAGSTAPESYVPYGYKLPMVSRTENLFDEHSPSIHGAIQSDGSINTNASATTYDYMVVEPSTVYHMKAFEYTTGYEHIARIAWYDENKDFLYRDYIMHGYKTLSKTSPANAKYCRISINNTLSKFVLIKESAMPTSYIPYSHEDTPIYIGENQLAENEYVSYGEQKIYRDVSGTLTPTDPPVPLPEIPTIKGETVIDYDGEPKPSQMYVKYKGEGAQ